MIAFVDSAWARDGYPASSGNWRVVFCKVPNNVGDACTTPSNPNYGHYGRHMDGAVASYMDGHAKWNKVSYFYNNGQNYPVWQGWQ